MFKRLPALEGLGKMNMGAMAIGWSAFTLSIAIGIILSKQLGEPFYRDIKLLTTLVVWLVYSTNLWGIWRGRWRGVRVVVWSLAGFLCAISSMIGSVYVWPSFHAFVS